METSVEKPTVIKLFNLKASSDVPRLIGTGSRGAVLEHVAVSIRAVASLPAYSLASGPLYSAEVDVTRRFVSRPGV